MYTPLCWVPAYWESPVDSDKRPTEPISKQSWQDEFTFKRRLNEKNCLVLSSHRGWFCHGLRGGENSPATSTPAASAVVIGGTPINSAPPATTTKAGTPVTSNLTLNPTTAKANDKITFSLAFTDTDANVSTFGIQFNGENKYYAYDVSSVASGNLAFNLTVQDTIGNVSPGTYQIIVFIIDKLGNVSNYLTGTLTVQGSSAPSPPATASVDVSGSWICEGIVAWNLTQNGSVVTGTGYDIGDTRNRPLTQYNGQITGNSIFLNIFHPDDPKWTGAVSGPVNGNAMVLTMSGNNQGNNGTTGTCVKQNLFSSSTIIGVWGSAAENTTIKFSADGTFIMDDAFTKNPTGQCERGTYSLSGNLLLINVTSDPDGDKGWGVTPPATIYLAVLNLTDTELKFRVIYEGRTIDMPLQRMN